jgi:hypothetical protein
MGALLMIFAWVKERRARRDTIGTPDAGSDDGAARRAA